MKSLPREFLDMAERVIREYPDRKEELAAWDHSIAALCHAPLISDTMGGGGSTSSEPERIAEIKDGNPHYQWLSRFVSIVGEALGRLTDEEAEVVDLSCWQGVRSWELSELLYMDERGVRRMKARALRKMVPLFLNRDVIRPEISD